MRKEHPRFASLHDKYQTTLPKLNLLSYKIAILCSTQSPLKPIPVFSVGIYSDLQPSGTDNNF